MYNYKHYEFLKSEYGKYGSWAIWEPADEKDTTIIHNNYKQLNSKLVVLGLNISNRIKSSPWSNFRGGKHDRKLKYALNNSIYRGCYLTDIFKGVEARTANGLKEKLTPDIIDKNASHFVNEMKDIKITSETKFLIMGTESSFLNKMFINHFKANFNNQIINYYHYAYFKLTDKNWVSGLWDKLGIKDNPTEQIKLYKNT